MVRLNHVKQELDDEQEKVSHNNAQLKNNQGDAASYQLSVGVPKHVKQEEEGDGIVKQVQPFAKVKKEEEGGECKLEWDGDECDCEQCRVDRTIKVEFRQNNATNNQQKDNSCPLPSHPKKGVPSQSSVCKRVKKEEDEDGELIGQWDEDCDCDACRRMRQKAIRLKQTNLMENGETGVDDDGEETEIDEDGNGNEDVLVGNDGNMAVDELIGDEDGDELDQESEQSKDGQESSEDQMSDVDDETEIDDEDYEMDVGGEESQTVEKTLPNLNGKTRKIVRQSARHLKQKQTDDEIATECTTNLTQPNLAQSNRHLQCPHCHKSFDHKSKLQRHLRVHTGERPFACEQCGKRFNEKGNLSKHQLIHQNIKQFQCHECDKQFTQKHHLLAHLLTHSGERPFTCLHCDKSFRERRNLTKHQLIHQSIKRFRCLECDKQFTQKHVLDSHLLIHSRVRPFECRHCEKSFTQLPHRNRHEQAIHLQVKPYRCKQCGHTATQLANIIAYIRMVHFGLPHTIK